MNKTPNKSTVSGSDLSMLIASLLDHPRAAEIHPLTKLPKGYRWMDNGETIREGCKYAKLGSPKWHSVTNTGGEYSVFGYHPMAAPISCENNEVGGCEPTDLNNTGA